MEVAVSYSLIQENCFNLKKDSEIKPGPLCLGNVSKDIAINNMKKTGLKEYVHAFSVDYNIINTNDIHKYLMKIA